jgi:hypothetical protein
MPVFMIMNDANLLSSSPGLAIDMRCDGLRANKESRLLLSIGAS